MAITLGTATPRTTKDTDANVTTSVSPVHVHVTTVNDLIHAPVVMIIIVTKHIHVVTFILIVLNQIKNPHPGSDTNTISTPTIINNGPCTINIIEFS